MALLVPYWVFVRYLLGKRALFPNEHPMNTQQNPNKAACKLPITRL